MKPETKDYGMDSDFWNVGWVILFFILIGIAIGWGIAYSPKKEPAPVVQEPEDLCISSSNYSEENMGTIYHFGKRTCFSELEKRIKMLEVKSQILVPKTKDCANEIVCPSEKYEMMDIPEFLYLLSKRERFFFQPPMTSTTPAKLIK